jgi:hypothetical protein
VKITVNFNNDKVSTWTFIDDYYIDHNKRYISFKYNNEAFLIPFDNINYITTGRDR